MSSLTRFPVRIKERAVVHEQGQRLPFISQRFLVNLPRLQEQIIQAKKESNPHSELDQYLGNDFTSAMPLPFKLATSLPFNHYYQLYPKLIIAPDGSKIFHQEPCEKDTLPGEPRVKLSDPRIGSFLLKELTTPDLNKFYPYLFSAGQQSHSDITPLSEQLVNGRSIVMTQNPELHLIWSQDRIYIKPIPKYLFSSSFWQYYIIYETSPLHDFEQTMLRESCTGFLRSYGHLIRHRCDFNLAQQEGLIPKYIRYTEFIQFITSFESLPDTEVSKRYCFGELRLRRLNLWAPLALRRLNFHDDVRGLATSLTQFYGPLFFVFVIITVVLNAMQVQMLTKQKAQRFFEFFSGLAIFLGIIVVLSLVILGQIRLVRGCVSLVRDGMRRRKEAKIDVVPKSEV